MNRNYPHLAQVQEIRLGQHCLLGRKCTNTTQRETLGWVDGLHRTRFFFFVLMMEGTAFGVANRTERETALAAGAAPEMLKRARDRIAGMDGGIAHDRASLRLVMDWERIYIWGCHLNCPSFWRMGRY